MGVMRYQDLRASGLSRRHIEAALRSGGLRRVARGWYSDYPDPELEAALALHGQLGCMSALRRHGVWVPPDRRLHVVVRHARGHSTPTGVVQHVVPDAGVVPVAEVDEALRHAVRFHDAESALIVLESALNLGLVTHDAIGSIVRQAHRSTWQVLRHVSDRAESGSESRVRLHFELRGVPVRAQVAIAGVGRVDLLVGESWVVECDSRAHHTGEESYQSDRLRDLRLAGAGFRCLRLTWEQVFLDWRETCALLTQILASRRHRLPPRPGAEIWLPDLSR